MLTYKKISLALFLFAVVFLLGTQINTARADDQFTACTGKNVGDCCNWVSAIGPLAGSCSKLGGLLQCDTLKACGTLIPTTCISHGGNCSNNVAGCTGAGGVFNWDNSTECAINQGCCIPAGAVPPPPPPGVVPVAGAGDTGGIVPCGKSGTGEAGMCNLCHLIVGIHKIIQWGLNILVIVGIVSIVAGGIYYIISAGNSELMEKAKTIIKNSFYGFAIVLAAWLLVNYTMILLGKKADMGIGVESWNEFRCDG